MSKRIAILKASPEFLVDLCKVHRGDPRFVRVKANALPDDAAFVGVVHDVNGQVGILSLMIRSESFAEVERGGTIPELPLPIFEVVYEPSSTV